MNQSNCLVKFPRHCFNLLVALLPTFPLPSWICTAEFHIDILCLDVAIVDLWMCWLFSPFFNTKVLLSINCICILENVKDYHRCFILYYI